MSKRRISALTSLRFFAASMIVFDHATANHHGWIRDIPYYQGVTFFFVLSGFILTYSYPVLIDKKDILNFWLARFARIWPAYFVSLVWAIILVPGWLTILATPYGAFRAVLSSVGLQAWVPQMDYFFYPNAVCWSLSVEAFFYLLFPFLIRELQARRYWTLLLCCIPTCLVLVTATASNLTLYAKSTTEVDIDALVYIFPPTRLPEFILGMLAALSLRQPASKRPNPAIATLFEIMAVAAVLAQYLIGPNWYETGPLSHMFPASVCLWLERSGSAPLYALLIGVIAREQGLLSRLLCFRPLVMGGEISYALYLLHQPLMWWIWANAGLFGSIPHFLRLALFVATILLTSYIMFVAIERPARRRIIRLFHFT
jgi:peptidoglycan/LPS O-acetylase OafA/YrhL